MMYASIPGTTALDVQVRHLYTVLDVDGRMCGARVASLREGDGSQWGIIPK